MSAPTPATLPGLLRAGTGVRWRDEETRYVVTAPPFPDADDALWVIAAPCAGIPLGVQDDPSNFTLDLDNATTRAHLAWWILDRAADPYFARMDRDEFAATVDAAERAYRGQPMNDRHINTLTTVARHLAGLESS